MKSERPAPRARRGLVFGAGLLLGAALAISARGAWQARDSGEPTTAAPASAAALPSVDAPRSSSSKLELPASISAPAGPVAAPTAESERRPVARASTLEPDALLDIVRRGRAEGWLEDGPLVDALFEQLVLAGLCDDAWELATRFAPDDVNKFVTLAQATNERGEVELRDRCIARAIELGWVDLDFLASVDPALAISRSAALVDAAAPEDRSDAWLGHAELLARLGRTSEALAILRAELALHPNSANAVALLCALDPAAGEAQLRALIDAGDPEMEWTGQLVAHLAADGRPAEAASYLRLLAANGHSVGSADWGALGAACAQQGDRANADAAWLEALALENGDPDPWTQPLLESAPDALLAALEARVASGGANDEFWGALAEARWAHGDRDGAISAWKQAALLDPADGEWPAKLASAAAHGNASGH
jgi:tetratricopeptide (TPR) repeat protein